TMYVCNDCPRRCRVDREIKVGFCDSGINARVAKTVAPFLYEEPILGRLSAVFFSGCSLRCSYCQNVAISRGAVGDEYDDEALARLFDGAVGALDLVTPTHYIGAIERAVKLCRTKKRIIWNTSGYETESGVKRAGEIADVFLTDIKYYDSEIARKYSAAPDYFERAKTAVKLMREKKDRIEQEDGQAVMTHGLVVRHLVLPGCAKDSMNVLDFVAGELGTDTYISLMSQFTPNGVGEPTARLSKIEYKIVAEHALKLGFKNGFFQDFSSADSSYTPKFKPNV
ncbi:MAG: radical SAM protein, partial [Clostridiales bacterium]|nr:radical SAM protein [Clostridiales bacterium]